MLRCKQVHQINRRTCVQLRQKLIPDRQLPDPFASCGKHRICQSWRNWRQPWFANASQWLAIIVRRYEMNMNLTGSCIDPRDLIAVEVVLLDPAILE